MRCNVSLVMNAVECMGCGAIWLEKNGHAVEHCPGCDRVTFSGNVKVNTENCPEMRELRDDALLVVWCERSEN